MATYIIIHEKPPKSNPFLRHPLWIQGVDHE
jgi:hypothetical protein